MFTKGLQILNKGLKLPIVLLYPSSNKTRCSDINNNNLKAAGAEAGGLERFQHCSGETLQTSIAAAYADQAPWFGYYWAPTAVLGKYPMVRVEVPAYNADSHACNGLL